MEQRPQPSEQSWKKGQARCVLIPVAPHSSLDKAARLPEIPAGRFGQLGNLSRLPADLLPQLFKDGFSQSLVISGEGKKIPVGRAAKQPGNLSGRAALGPFGECGECPEQIPDTVPTSAPPARRDGACRRASHLGMLPWLRGHLLLLTSGLMRLQPC